MDYKYLVLYPVILAGTYITNAVVSPLYSNNCIQIMNYNSPVCTTALSIMVTSASLNYWTYYISLTSTALFILSKTIGRRK
jgi:hypothetical protein|tara:strand:+ start:267 stop:509 length:243 start_codon:yes stop_codon:yes gene_type:complete